MTRSATKHLLLSATAHVALVLCFLAFKFPHKLVAPKPHQRLIFLSVATPRKPIIPDRHVPKPADFPSKVLGAPPTKKVFNGAYQAQLSSQSITPPVLETQLPLQEGESLSGLLGPESRGNWGGLTSPSKPCSTRPDPVEIVSKPKPTYSLEALELHLEGDVSIQVVFLANGTIRLLRVTNGLGHGLDEAAIEAARQIRFKPASCAGITLDVAATIHVTFQLTKRHQPVV